MYHCYISFYFIGCQREVLEVIKAMQPLEHFTHKFWESTFFDKELAGKADVIFFYLQNKNEKEILQNIILNKKEEAELILLTEKEKLIDITDSLLEIKDIWIMPMLESEIRFRFLRWQQTYKMSKDFWQTNHYLEAAIDNSPNLIWYKDKNGVHKKVNNSFCRTVNKTKEQVEGRTHAYIWNVEQDDPACIESELEVMKKRKTCISEESIKTGDGIKLLTTYKSPLYNLDGSVMGTVGVAIDVTQEHAYKEEIIKKNQTLETIFTTIDCGVMRYTIDGKRILSINRAALKILGYESQEELIADGFYMVPNSVIEGDREKVQIDIKKLKNETDNISAEYCVQHKDGEILDVMSNIKLLEENGELFYQCFLLDCTKQKQQEKRDKKYQMELIQALSIDYNLVCFFELNTGNGTLIRSDDYDKKLFGSAFNKDILLEESINHYIQEFVHKDDREMLQKEISLENLKKELTKKKQHYINYRICREEEVIYFQIKVVRAGSWEKNRGIVLGIRSVDEEIRNEMKKKDLLQDALLQANRASKAKSVFLSNMSHDIRTPMNAIVGFTTLAITHIEQRELVEEYLKKIQTSGNHLLSLINDVLDMSRIESGKMHLEEKPCSLPDILHGLCNILQADIHAKQLTLDVDAVDILDEKIYCDKLRLNQILLNLLSNAVKYTSAGGNISLRITEKSNVQKDYATYEFVIKDNGIGMSKEFVEHIFEPFEREKCSTTSGIQGTGLGMAITKNIVDMMNGSIFVKSEQGVGTEVTVSIVFRLYAIEKETKDIPKLKNCRALVVDDDFNTCDSVSYMLGQIGMRAEWTLSGKEALLRTHQAVTRKDNYYVYIIDWILPDMNGVEVTRRIRKEMGEDVSIIILTAYDWSDIEEEAREAGVTAFCSKPLFFSELKNCLNSIVDSKLEKESKNRNLIRLRTGRILLAEDNELNQEIATVILEDAGFLIEVANNGKEAVDMLKRSEPGYYQLILMDVKMPVMDGYEATKEIRKLENKKLSSIPILAMTANAFEEDKQEAIKCGMNGHLAKPINIESLFSTLDKVLNEEYMFKK